MVEESAVSPLKRFEGRLALNRIVAFGIAITAALVHLAVFFYMTEFWEDPFRYWEPFFALWFTVPLLLLGFFALENGNRYPTIWTGNEGLYISFNFSRIFIPWHDVIGVQEKRFFLEDNRIYARKITWFHYLYGSYYWAWGPTILIDPSMSRDTYDALLDEIEKHLPNPYL